MIQGQQPSEESNSVSSKADFRVTRRAALLLSGQGCANITMYTFTTLLLVWIFLLTNSEVAVSGILLASVLPSCFLGPLAGVFVDRWNRRTTMLGTTGVFVLAALLPVFAPLALRLPVLFASALIISAASCCFMPAKTGLLKEIVPEHRQDRIAYVSSALFTAGFVCGPALAPFLYFVVGPAPACLVCAACFLLSTACLLALHPPVGPIHALQAHVRQESQLASSITAIWHEFIEGIDYVMRSRVLFILLLVLCLESFASSFLNALNIVFVTHVLGVPVSFLGPINAAIGGGTLVGAVLMGVLIRRVATKHLFAGGIFLVGIGIFVYALQTHYLFALLIVGLAVVPQSGIDIGLGPMLMEATPLELVGRTQSAIETSMLIASLPALALAGFLGQALPVTVIIAGDGALTALAGIIGVVGLAKRRGRKRESIE